MSKVDIPQALDLRLNHHNTYAQIGAIQGLNPQTIHKALKHLIPNESTKYYQNNRAGIWDRMAVTLLSQVDSARLKKMSARDAIISAGICYDKSAAERGQANVVIAYDAGSQWARVQELRALLEQSKQPPKAIVDNTALQVIDITNS